MTLRIFSLRRKRQELGRGYVVVNTTSRSKTQEWAAGLSPFFIGPVDIGPDPETGEMLVSMNVENAWQYSKVYACHADGNGNPTKEYWEWAREGFSNTAAKRFPMGIGAKPLYSLGYIDGEWRKLAYIEARQLLYCPFYSAAVVLTDAYKHLEEVYVSSSGKVALLDFDGYDHVAMGRSLEEVMMDGKKKMGHAFVLAGLLTGRLFWLDGEMAKGSN